MKYLKVFEKWSKDGQWDDDHQDSDDIVTIYTYPHGDPTIGKYDPSKTVEKKVKFYDLPHQFYDNVASKIMKDRPDIYIHQRGRGQFYDFEERIYDREYSRPDLLWFGCYDIVGKNFYIFTIGKESGTISELVEEYSMRRTGTEICIDNIEMEDGYLG